MHCVKPSLRTRSRRWRDGDGMRRSTWGPRVGVRFYCDPAWVAPRRPQHARGSESHLYRLRLDKAWICWWLSGGGM